MYKALKNDSGSALVVALLMLIMLSFIGIAAISTSVRDMDIAKNTTDRTKAFYVAESGLEAAYAVLKSYPNIFGNDTLLGEAGADSLDGEDDADQSPLVDSTDPMWEGINREQAATNDGEDEPPTIGKVS